MNTDRFTPRLLMTVVAAVLILAALAYLPQYYGESQTKLYAEAIYIAIAALGLNLLTGYSGQVSIGHGAFYGLGAYGTAILMFDHDWNFFATLPVVAVLTFVVGAAVGFPALRLSGMYLALITLGLATLFPDLVTRFVKGTGGTSLVQPRNRPVPPEWAESFASEPDQWWYYITLAIAVVMLVLLWNLVRGRFGRALLAVRDHEAAATTVGIDAARVKVSAFAISALYAGIAGSCSVLITGLANAGRVEVFQQSIFFLVAVVIGGTATVIGPVVGAFVVVFLDDWAGEVIADKPVLSPAIFGIALILLMYVLPDGLVGGSRRAVAVLRRRFGSRAEPIAPPVPT
ncbi:MAG TPA: branched-chain amino acid ABC transporter permease [Acidimicrobiia bacterium]|nr:branched-chain amino acid ABC transporter permease [Acidimicrobiia bacterium]